MANAILAQVRGHQYRMYGADNAGLDPAAELGDGVTVGGIYSVISRMDDDGSGYVGLSAPGEEELEDEYPSAGPMTREFNRKIAQTRSSITKTAASITLMVENEVEGLEGKLQLTASSLTSEIANAREGLSSKIEQTASGIQAQVNGLDSAYSRISQTVDSIGIGVYNGDESSTITLYKNGISVSSQTISFRGMVTFSDLSGSAGTIVDGGAINTGTLMLNALHGDNIYLYGDRGAAYGPSAEFRIGNASSAFDRCELWARAIALNAWQGSLFLECNAGTTLQLGVLGVQIEGDVLPNSASRYSCGTSGFHWTDVYADNGTIVTSDREKKKDVGGGLDRYGSFFDALRPVSYKLADGTSGRTHLGLIAQDVESALVAAGLTDMDFAGFIKSPREGGGYDYALRYGEFIPLCIEKIQKLTVRVTELERRLAR